MFLKDLPKNLKKNTIKPNIIDKFKICKPNILKKTNNLLTFQTNNKNFLSRKIWIIKVSIEKFKKISLPEIIEIRINSINILDNIPDKAYDLVADDPSVSKLFLRIKIGKYIAVLLIIFFKRVKMST